MSRLHLNFIRLAFLCFCSRFDVDDTTVAAARPVFYVPGRASALLSMVLYAISHVFFSLGRPHARPFA
jgi:hypothetical protein